MIPQRGNPGVVDYKWLSCDHPEHQNVVGIDCLAGSENTKLQVLHEIEACAGGPVMTADKVANDSSAVQPERETTERAVSVHLFAPIDSCVAFDMEGRRCYRRQLAYFSMRRLVSQTRRPSAARTRFPGATYALSPLPRLDRNAAGRVRSPASPEKWARETTVGSRQAASASCVRSHPSALIAVGLDQLCIGDWASAVGQIPRSSCLRELRKLLLAFRHGIIWRRHHIKRDVNRAMLRQRPA